MTRRCETLHMSAYKYMGIHNNYMVIIETFSSEDPQLYGHGVKYYYHNQMIRITKYNVYIFV